MGLTDNMRGALWMALSMTSFVVNDTFMRLASDAVPFYQAIFLRGLMISIGLAAIAWSRGHLRYRPAQRDWGLIGLRTLAEVIGTLLFLTALLHMAFANLSAILQALPLTVSLGAALVFREPLGWRRLTAILVGFVGVLLIVQPGTEAFNLYAVLGVATVLVVTVRDLSARRLSRDVPSGLVALAAALGGTAMGAIGVEATGEWAALTPVSWIFLGLAALCLMAGYTASVSAMRSGEIGFVAPFRYTSLLVALVIGLAVFDEWPNTLALTGAVLVVGTGLFTLYRERQLTRRTTLGLRIR
jgi:drug/metabolite transporter (DMT)-like permease